MSTTPKDLYKKAMSLPDQERAELVGMLLETLDVDEDSGVEAAWLTEIERRVEELDSGAVESVPWSEVRARVFAARDA
jgi:putative addiction module component (TIGR02574 family)